MKYIIFNGLKYIKDEKTGYYRNSTTKKRLHRAIWEYYKGEIPKGYEIHHIDRNKDNNNIDNLQLLSKKEHLETHSKLLTDGEREWRRNNLNIKARPEAIKWHKSNEGKEWHKEQYKKTLALKEEKDFICLNCGNKYKSKDTGKNKFCSNNCKSIYRRKLGLDYIEKECAICGRIIKTNKYRPATWCKNCKSKKNKIYG